MSIVIANHNGLEYLRMCVLAVRLFTRSAYELVVVDNGSSDGSVEWLSAQPDIRVVANAENLGFPAASNQGIERARGDLVLLLNNDVVVTPGWLERLLGALERSERIGLVGPVTNRISGPQQVRASYTDLASLESFAGRWARTNAGRLASTDRLVGFCLLIRKELFDRIGLLDERFGIGNFEDDDFCRRALAAGYDAVISAETFVHHFGSVTFRALGIDLANRVLEHSENLFREKWSLPQKISTEDGEAPRRVGLSLAMIVRDNERTIEAALASIKPWVDEMIVVDTGSTDRTPEICRRMGAKVHEFTWCDDFARARNESLAHCGGEWIFWMDSDDVIDEANGRKLRDLLRSPIPASVQGFVMQVHCPGDDARGECGMTVVDHVKLIRNRPELRFEGRIHEQILPAIRAAGGDVKWTDIFVVHAGSDHSHEGRQRKLQRDFRILEQDLRERPEHPFVLFNLGMTHSDAGNHGKAIEYLRRSIERSDASHSHLRKAYALLVHASSMAGDFAAAWQAVLAGRKLFPRDPELLFREAMLHHHFRRYQEAERCYQEVLRGGDRDERHFASVDQGIAGYKARHNLARVYEDMGNFRAAKEQWTRITEEFPDYGPGWRGFGDLLFGAEGYRAGAACGA